VADDDNAEGGDSEIIARGSGARKEKVMSSEDYDDGKLLTKGEVAQLCRVDIRTVDRWLMAGKVACQRTPSGRVLFRKYDVLTVVAPAKISVRRRER
jgi:hypothetical protein